MRDRLDVSDPPLVPARSARYAPALACAVLVMLLATSLALARDAGAQSSTHGEGRTDVRVEGRTEGGVRGVVRALNQATLSTDLPLLALDVPLREGDRFRRGDLLAAFDCRRQVADHAATLAQLREAELNLDSSRHLDRHNAVGKNDVAIAAARVDRMRAEAAALKARLDECRFVAPFDGRIVELAIRKYERTVPQRPYLSIIDDGVLEIETIAPSVMLQALTVGARFAFRVDELGGRVVDADVVSVAAAVDPVSKTVKVIGRIAKPIDGLLAGMSGTAEFNLGH